MSFLSISATMQLFSLFLRTASIATLQQGHFRCNKKKGVEGETAAAS